MVDVDLRVPDGVDGGGGVYSQSPDSDRIGFLLDLHGGAQRQPLGKFQSIRPVFAAIGLMREEDIVAKARFDFSDRGIRGPPALKGFHNLNPSGFAPAVPYLFIFSGGRNAHFLPVASARHFHCHLSNHLSKHDRVGAVGG